MLLGRHAGWCECGVHPAGVHQPLYRRQQAIHLVWSVTTSNKPCPTASLPTHRQKEKKTHHHRRHTRHGDDRPIHISSLRDNAIPLSCKADDPRPTTDRRAATMNRPGRLHALQLHPCRAISTVCLHDTRPGDRDLTLAPYRIGSLSLGAPSDGAMSTHCDRPVDLRRPAGHMMPRRQRSRLRWPMCLSS